MAYSIETLPEERHEAAIAVAEAWELAQELEGDAAVTALQNVYDRAAAIELPMYMVLARIGRLVEECMRDEYRASITTYLETMRLLDTHHDVIDPAIAEVAHHAAAGAFVGLVSMPEVSREQLAAFLDEVEREQRRMGAPLWSPLLCRAVWAAQIGDAEATRRWVDEWHIEGPASGEGHANTVALDGMFLAAFDLDGAVEYLDRHLPTTRFDANDEDAVRIEFATRHAGFRALSGDDVRAAADMVQLVERYGIDAVIEHGEHDGLVRALETIDGLGDKIAASVEAALDLDDPNQYLTTAALARRHLRRAPDSARGRELGEIAERGALAFDRRNGTRFLSGQLVDRWFAGL